MLADTMSPVAKDSLGGLSLPYRQTSLVLQRASSRQASPLRPKSISRSARTRPLGSFVLTPFAGRGIARSLGEGMATGLAPDVATPSMIAEDGSRDIEEVTHGGSGQSAGNW